MADELMNMVDAHLAWQAGAEDQRSVRPSLDKQPSAGTLIVDWDGTGVPIVSRRNKATEEPLTRRVEVETKLEALQARVKSRHLAKEHHCQERTRASQAKRVKHEQDSFQPTAQSRYVVPLSLTSQDRRKERSKLPVRHDAAHSRGRYSHPHHTHAQERENARPSYNQNTYGRAPSNYKSTHAVDCTSHAPTLRSRSRTSSTTAHYHRSPSAPRSTEVQYHHSPSSGHQIRYSAGQNLVKGYDPPTAFAYDYNGQIVHVHRDTDELRQLSGHSDYIEVPAETWVPDVPVKLVGSEKALPDVPEKQGKAVDKVFEFVQKVLRKLDKMGIMGKFKRGKEGGRRG
ncbi:hypothetical protein CC86DRAFT_451905 [Ophiobolus disseminans]|uniref:Uncharacterized protein n=1 Tax=Ophiobolus disseminans TaxID=1469910 RepID=A0A6A7AI41_9PLEO|nr:hypothetical protein CC86DRAFT_451905 [Ophiobolus disseminans]